MINNIKDEEIDIQIAGTRIFDYICDLMMIMGHSIDKPYSRTEIRIQFGDACVEMYRAIKYANGISTNFNDKE